MRIKYYSGQQVIDVISEFANSKDQLLNILNRFGALETDDVEPIRHGEWIKKESETTYWWECSECGEEPLRDGYGWREFSRYCPSCGALMYKGET